MENLTVADPTISTAAAADSKEKWLIQVLGVGDQRTRDLKANLQKALVLMPIGAEVAEVTEFNKIYSSGVSITPALLFGDRIMAQGRVPSVEEIETMLRQRFLVTSKLDRLLQIAVATDFSKSSENAFRYAWHLAAQFDAQLEVVHSFEGIFDGMDPTFGGHYEEIRADVAAELKLWTGLLTEHLEARNSQRPVVSTRLLDGFPIMTLADFSEKTDLLVLSTEGKSNFIRKNFSTISIETARRAHCPVLLVPPNSAWNEGLEDIAYAANFESIDALTVRQTVAFSKKFNARLHFVHVGHEKAAAAEQLDRTFFKIRYLDSEPNKAFRYRILDGSQHDVALKLQTFLKDEKMSLVVFITEQRSLWERWLHGPSQTKKMALALPVPMLVVHLDHDQI